MFQHLLTFQVKLLLKIFRTPLKETLKQKERLFLDHQLERKWYSLLMMSICLSLIDISLNHHASFFVKPLIHKDFMTQKNWFSNSLKIQDLFALALLQEEVEMPFHQDYSDISTWFGYLNFLKSVWEQYSLQFCKDSLILMNNLVWILLQSQLLDVQSNYI